MDPVKFTPRPLLVPLNVKFPLPDFTGTVALDDLSYQVVSTVFGAGGIPFERGSAPSSHNVRPFIFARENPGVAYEYISPFAVLIYTVPTGATMLAGPVPEIICVPAKPVDPVSPVGPIAPVTPV